jgi:hypothetical protein
MQIIQAIKDPNLFRTFLEVDGSLKSWKHWFTALKVLYGLGFKSEECDLIRECTGRDPYKLPLDGFRTALFLCGRRSGKSRISAVIATFEALLAGTQSKLASGELGLVPVISPTKKQSRIVKEYIRAIFDSSAFLQSELKEHGADKEGFPLINNTRIEILTADWRTVRSYTTLAIVVDEICFMGMDDESKVRSDTELIRALEPTRATTNGKLIGISSPYAEKGWAWEQWKKGWGNNDSKILIWKAPSRTMNPTLLQSVIDEALETDEASARAEYLGEWRSDVASFVPRELVEECIQPKGTINRPPISGVKYTAFVDMSGGRHDDSAISIAHVDDGRAVQDVIKRFKAPHSPAVVIAQIAEILKPYGIRRVIGDNYAADLISDAFVSKGIKFTKSEKTKSAIYIEFLPLITSGKCILLDNDFQTNQICSLERRTRVGGKDSIDHPPKHKDDVANACAGAIVHAAITRMVVGVFGEPSVGLNSEDNKGYEVNPIYGYQQINNGVGFSEYKKVQANQNRRIGW